MCYASRFGKKEQGKKYGVVNQPLKKLFDGQGPALSAVGGAGNRTVKTLH